MWPIGAETPISLFPQPTRDHISNLPPNPSRILSPLKLYDSCVCFGNSSAWVQHFISLFAKIQRNEFGLSPGNLEKMKEWGKNDEKRKEGESLSFCEMKLLWEKTQNLRARAGSTIIVEFCNWWTAETDSWLVEHIHWLHTIQSRERDGGACIITFKLQFRRKWWPVVHLYSRLCGSRGDFYPFLKTWSKTCGSLWSVRCFLSVILVWIH